MQNHAEENAKCWLATIIQNVADLEDNDNIHETILGSVLAVTVRNDWHTPGESNKPTEYCVLLTTGGPALRMIGSLSCGEPETARLEWQDWGTPWTEYKLTSAEEVACIKFASCFYFEE